MRGRTIYYNNRRILVFCGYKRNTPHSIYDVFGRAAETATTGENTETFITETNNFPESESGGAVGNDDEAFITSATRQIKAESGVSLAQTADGVAYSQVMALVDDNMSTGNNAEMIKTGSVLSKAKSGATTGANGETIKTPVPKFTESRETVETGENNDDFITSHHNEAEAESGISTRQSAEAVVRSTSIIYAGDYESRASILISDLEALDIENIPFYEDFYGEIFVYNELIVDPSKAEVWGMIVEDDVLQRIAEEEILDDPPTIFRWRIENENQRFTVTADTTVTAEQYEIFNRYFQLVPNNNA